MMSLRIWTIVALMILLGATAGCSGDKANQAPAGPPPVVKTLRPTFTSTVTKKPTLASTPTPAKPTATPQPPATTAPPPTAPPPTAEKAQLSPNSGTVNVRSGPGTNYARIGEASQGQTFEITGKNPGGDWWQINFNGQPAWVFGGMVTANAAAGNVQVAQNIPAAPPPPAPAPAPKPAAAPAPTSPPAPTFSFGATGMTPRINTNPYLIVYCKVSPDNVTGIPGAIQISGPGGAPPPVKFGTILRWANTGMSSENRFLYNDGCKVEIRPFVEGAYTARMVDSGGNPVSESITLNASGNMREFVVAWKPR
jgi:hypothetical protein